MELAFATMKYMRHRCVPVCDVALLRHNWMKNWCMPWLLIYFCILQNGLSKGSKGKMNEQCEWAQEWKIEVDIFNTFNIYWCIELNSEYVAIFLLSLPLHSLNVFACIKLLNVSQSYYDGVKLSILKKKREKKIGSKY